MNKKTAADLRSHGVSKEDIRVAEILEHNLIRLDLRVFGDNHIKRLNLCIKPGIRKMAYYVRNKNGKNEFYSISVIGLAKEIRSIMVGRCIFVSKGKRWKTKKSSATVLSMENACLRIAAHEVRHRMQFKGKVTQFSKSYAKRAHIKWASKKANRRSLFTRTLNWCRHYFDIRTEDFRKTRRTSKFIMKETSRIEFDAVFIEHFVANMIFLYPSLDLEGIAEIVKMRPPKIS